MYSSQTSNDGIMGYLDTFDFEGEYISWTTDGANAGTVFYRNGRFNCTNVCGLIIVKQEYDTQFIALALSMNAKKYVSANLANPKLMNGAMSSVLVPIPFDEDGEVDMEEQRRIAGILSDMDEEIRVKETLLAKHRALKQGVMQQLLAPDTMAHLTPDTAAHLTSGTAAYLAPDIAGEATASTHTTAP